MDGLVGNHCVFLLATLFLKLQVVVFCIPFLVVCQTHAAELDAGHVQVEREFLEGAVNLILARNVHRAANTQFHVGDGFILDVAIVFVVSLNKEVGKCIFELQLTEHKVEIEVLNLTGAEHISKAFLFLVVVQYAERSYITVVKDFALEQRNLELAVEGKLAEIVLLYFHIYVVHREGKPANGAVVTSPVVHQIFKPGIHGYTRFVDNHIGNRHFDAVLAVD